MSKPKENTKHPKCPSCDSGNLLPKQVDQSLFFPENLEFKISSVNAEVCNNCGNIFIDLEESGQLDKKFLAEVWGYFANKSEKLPGKVANWIRKVIGITARDLAEIASLEESTLSHNFGKNTNLDRFAATILLLKAKDFLDGSSRGHELVSGLQDLRTLWPKLSVKDIVSTLASKDFTVTPNIKRKTHRRPAAKATTKKNAKPNKSVFQEPYYKGLQQSLTAKTKRQGL